ncbi:MAG: ATP-binding protein, partial [Oscillospiraceae bacterium]
CYDISKEAAVLVIPKLILQPLVENSIYHGIRPKGEKGIIKISAWLDEGFLNITIYDSGIGMSEEKINKLMNGDNNKSFGFKGTIERIRCFYQRNDVVKIESVEGEFCKIEITVPCGDGNNSIIAIEQGGIGNVSGDDS